VHSWFEFQKVCPATHGVAPLFAKYKRVTAGRDISLHDYLLEMGSAKRAPRKAKADEAGRASAGAGGPRIDDASRSLSGTVRVIVLLADFADQPGARSVRQYEDMLFSTASLRSGSMRELYAEMSARRVDIVGSVNGWLRMPKPYAFYVDNQSGLGLYPWNAQRLAEDAVRQAVAERVAFPRQLDSFGGGEITSLFIVHAGPSAEAARSAAAQKRRLWSHHAALEQPVMVRDGLAATRYVSLPEDCGMGACAPELGHLAFRWQHCCDSNAAKKSRDGAARWALRACDEWNSGEDSRSCV
jgi:immune inhibitor A